MNRAVFFICAALLVTACTPAQPRWVWSRPAGSAAERQTDRAECRRLTHRQGQMPFVAYPSGGEYYQEREALFRDCMEERGWRLVPPEEAIGN